MQTTEYHLYRAKFIKSAQLSIISADLSPRDFFEKALAERLSLELRKNNVWHIGNIEPLTEDAGRFAVGRKTITTIEKFDDDSGDFTELLDDSGPYTYVYFDSRIGLLGIGKRAKVASDVKSIARNIEKLFKRTKIISSSKITVSIEHIPDPESFLEKIQSAYAIKSFKAHFTGPNPIDADEIFQKPMSYYCQQLEGDQGSVSVSGKSLNANTIVLVAKSTAATANGASSLIQTEQRTKPVSISFKGDARKVIVDQDTSGLDTPKMLQEAYREIRE